MIDRKLIESAHAHGLQVHVWTVNSRSEMGELLDLGVDGIITDRPDVLKEVLRGAWAMGLRRGVAPQGDSYHRN